MASKVITLSLREDVEKRLREMAMAKYGREKGFISKFLTDMVEKKSLEKEMGDADRRLMQMIERGLSGGGLKKYKREELYER